MGIGLLEDGSKDEERQLRVARSRFDATGEAKKGAEATFWLGTIARRKGRLREAESLLREAKTRFERIHDIFGIALATQELGSVVLQRFRLDEAERLLSDAFAQFDALDIDLGRANSALQLADIVERRGQLERADVLLREALPMFQSGGDDRGVANVLLRLAGLALISGQLDQAEIQLNDALSQFEALGSGLGIAGAKVDLGRLAIHRGRLDQAEVLLREAATGYEELREVLGAANAMLELGHAAFVRGRYPEAAVVLREALVRNKSIGNEIGIANTFLMLGLVRLAISQPDEAARLFGRALTRFVRAGHSIGVAHTVRQLASVSVALDQPTEALRRLQDAAERYASLADPNEAWALAPLAELLSRQNDPQAALDPARRAVARLERLRGSLRSVVIRSETGSRWEEVYEIAVRALLAAAAANPVERETLVHEALATACLFQGRLLHEELVTARRLPEGDPWAYLAPDEATEAAAIEARLDAAQAAYDALLERTRRELAERGVNPDDLEHSARSEIARSPETAELLAAMGERRQMLERALLRASADRDPVLPEIELSSIEAALHAEGAALVDLVWSTDLHVGFVLRPDRTLSVCDFDVDPDSLAAIETAREQLGALLAAEEDGKPFDAESFSAATATLAERLWRPLAGSLGPRPLRLVLPAALGAVPFAELARRIGGSPLRLLPGPALLVSRGAA